MKRTSMICAALLLAVGASRAGAAGPAPAAPTPTAGGVRTLYLVRHGAYDGADPRDEAIGKALVPIGVAQARLVGARLRALPFRFDALHASPLTRAFETARVISGVLDDLPPRVDPDLAECTPPTRRADVMAREKPEDLASCTARLERVAAKLLVPSPAGDRRELVVAHGNVIRYLVTRALAVDPAAWLGFSVGNASVSVISVDPRGGARVLSVGDVGHLPPPLQTGAVGDREPELAVPAPPEATSLLGRPLHRPALDAETTGRLERQLAEARARHDAAPGDADAIVWLGRRTAYLGRYREAIAIFSDGIAKHPKDARLYRHRGHRFITVRDFDAAIRDLEGAAELVKGVPDEVEPDGMPNKLGIPTSTLQGNIHYHLGLARYLKGDFEGARRAYQDALRLSKNDDTLVAVSDWLYMILRRLGRVREARAVLTPIRREMKILENDAYHRRLLMYRGELQPGELLAPDADAVQAATQGYGVGCWYLVNGQKEKAFAVFRRVVEGPSWGAFGFIAAEAELAR